MWLRPPEQIICKSWAFYLHGSLIFNCIYMFSSSQSTFTAHWNWICSYFVSFHVLQCNLSGFILTLLKLRGAILCPIQITCKSNRLEQIPLALLEHKACKKNAITMCLFQDISVFIQSLMPMTSTSLVLHDSGSIHPSMQSPLQAISMMSTISLRPWNRQGLVGKERNLKPAMADEHNDTLPQESQ